MKKFTVITILFITAAAPAFPVDFYLKLGAGAGHTALSSLNQVLRDWEKEQILDARSRPNWAFISGETGKLRSFIDLEGEVKLVLHSNLAVSFSSGIIHSNLSAGESELIIERTLGPYDVIHPIKVSGFPFIFSGYFQLPVMSGTLLFLRAGAGFMTARLVEQTGFKKSESPNYILDLDQNTVGSGPVYLGSMGASYQISQGTHIFLEAAYRNSHVKNFKKDHPDGDTFFLYSYQKYNPDLNIWSRVLRLHQEKPEGENIHSAGPAEVNLSGFSVKLGIMIRF